MAITSISAVTFAVRDMGRSIEFYQKLGFVLSYDSATASFSTMRADEAYVNLVLKVDYEERWWGRTIFRVDHADEEYARALAAGLKVDPPRDAPWGERYFHIRDPDGHELSFAQIIQQQS
ncbi:MAG: VOC family protein [Myxococcales bacterium]|jgi:catechol 2,3-dioxygenase-like lactoylglutathione lyase family enzyme|nr:MAG: VOC family protein [Myxococcales bacterium]